MSASFFFFGPAPPPLPSTSSRNTTIRKGVADPNSPGKKVHRETIFEFFLKREIPGQACLSNLPAFPSVFFFPFSIGKGGWMGRLSISSSSGKKFSCSGASKKEKRRRGGKQCQTRSQPPFHFPPPSPCHSFPARVTSCRAFSPSPHRSVQYPLLLFLLPLFPYRGVNRMRYSRLGEREETEEEDRRWMDGRGGMVGSGKITNYTGRNNLQLVLKLMFETALPRVL